MYSDISWEHSSVYSDEDSECNAWNKRINETKYKCVHFFYLALLNNLTSEFGHVIKTFINILYCMWSNQKEKCDKQSKYHINSINNSIDKTIEKNSTKHRSIL